uniref:BACK domain-containing protein n=1 Tax=Panagrellus redivivus TaxID=6233 RepID=A0A7E4W3Z2_PANRE
MKNPKEPLSDSDSASSTESSEEGKSPATTPKSASSMASTSTSAASTSSNASRKSSTSSTASGTTTVSMTSTTSGTSASTSAGSVAASPAVLTAKSPASAPPPPTHATTPKRSHHHHLKPMTHLKTAKTMSSTSVTSIGNLNVPLIRLKTYREDYFMAVSAFLKVSMLTLGENYTPPIESDKISDKKEDENMTICLYEYDVQAVRALADFVHNDGTHTNLKVPPSALIDLLELSEVFHIQLLTQSVHNWILQSATKSVSQLAHALQLLSDVRIRCCPVGGKLFTLALSHFRALPQAHTFTSLSPAMLVEILDACELPAKTEVEVFDIILRYLHRRNDRLLIAYELVSCVRQSRISDVFRRWMVDALGRLPQGEQLKAIVAMVINEENAFRCCVLKEHRNFVRCGELPREVRGCRFTIFSNKIDLEGVAHRPGETEHDHPFKTRSGRIFINREIPKKSYRAERRALREAQRLKDEQVNKRILAGLEK